jgi:BMFP domain-containing protein YqiC
MQQQFRLFDDLARMAGGAAGAAAGMRDELHVLVRQGVERMIGDLDMVPRDEFDAVKAMAAEARAQQEKMAEHITALEAQVAALQAAIEKDKD